MLFKSNLSSKSSAFIQFLYLLIMATRSRIGIQIEGGIVSAYHHWDGYPEWLGVTLNKNFNDEKSVKELIDGGDMSCCHSDNGWDFDEKYVEPRPVYYAERGEDTPPQLSESITEYLNLANDNCGEFAYLFVGGEWFCYDTDRYGKGFARLVDIPADYPKEVAA